ncbi:MAG: hypothetical protein WEB85_14980 [Dongiaceae bacterium]
MKRAAAGPARRTVAAVRKKPIAGAIGAAAIGAGAMLAPEALSGAAICTGEAPAYERALLTGTTAALQGFLRDYPTCPLTPAAFALLNALVEPAAGTAAAPIGSVAFGVDPPAPVRPETDPTDPGRPDRPDRESAY